MLTALCEGETLVSAVGGDANQIGKAFDGPQRDVRYYGLAEAAMQFRRQDLANRSARNSAKWAVRYLRVAHAGQFDEIKVVNDGKIVVAFTTD